jgi:hypothetical protein
MKFTTFEEAQAFVGGHRGARLASYGNSVWIVEV